MWGISFIRWLWKYVWVVGIEKHSGYSSRHLLIDRVNYGHVLCDIINDSVTACIKTSKAGLIPFLWSMIYWKWGCQMPSKSWNMKWEVRLCQNLVCRRLYVLGVLVLMILQGVWEIVTYFLNNNGQHDFCNTVLSNTF